MIGVIAEVSQRQVVEEFFELFKTPWEWYRPRCGYEVVIVTGDDWPIDLDAKLTLVFGTSEKVQDLEHGVRVSGQQTGGLLSHRDGKVPVYSGLATLQAERGSVVCTTFADESVGVRLAVANQDRVIIRLGYDLFEEIAFLLTTGQPVQYAAIPSLEIHIQMLREWFLECGISFIEVTPSPADCRFIVCLTHDIDFIGIRRHFLDHSMWGFVLRATVGSLVRLVRGRLTFSQAVDNWFRVLSLPFVYLGWARDFWEPFEWYLDVERGLSPTYFLIPYSHRPGEQVPGRHAARRGSGYGVADLEHVIPKLEAEGCEIGVHGIDSWHCAQKGALEKAEVEAVSSGGAGIRMHWLLRDEKTPQVLEDAGYRYDSTSGYNETIGFWSGTTQVYRPLGANTLLELPMNIQDGALFYPSRLNLREWEAEQRCLDLVEKLERFGGVLTLLWHDRSHGPERHWGDFYRLLLDSIRTRGVWFAAAGQATEWFRKRRSVRFERENRGGEAVIRLKSDGDGIEPPLRLRLVRQALPGAVQCEEIAWPGDRAFEFRPSLQSGASTERPLS